MVQKIRYCGCFGRRETNDVDQNDAYESAPISSNQAPIVAFQHSSHDDSDPNEPSSSSITNRSVKHFLGLSWRKHKDRKLPQIPPKSVTFSRVHDIPHIDDPIPTYESIDADLASSDATYSKVDDRQRYDYPVFPQRYNKLKNTEENLYSSASQTYSLGGSEDPYSSIASVCDNRVGGNDDASVGYARVNDDQMRNTRQKPSTSSNIDDLYAKVNRKMALERRIQNGLLPSTSTSRNLQQIQPTTSNNFMNDPEENIYQMDESGSGSITSSSSCNPSYRYLTVRESLGVIRERMRRRNEEFNYSTETNPSVAKEHYYSTISNDYDSVRNEPDLPTSSNSNYPIDRNSSLTNELRINTVVSQPVQFRRLPPTSPIPQPPIQKSPAVSVIESSALPTNTFSVGTLLNPIAFSLLPPFAVTPRISKLEHESGFGMASSVSMTSRPIVISMANVLRKHESTPNIKFMKDIGTSTSEDLNELSKIRQSKIPRLIHHHKKENTLSSRKIKYALKRPQSFGFIPVGNDYVSLIDFSRKDERGWPFDRTL